MTDSDSGPVRRPRSPDGRPARNQATPSTAVRSHDVYSLPSTKSNSVPSGDQDTWEIDVASLPGSPRQIVRRRVPSGLIALITGASPSREAKANSSPLGDQAAGADALPILVESDPSRAGLYRGLIKRILFPFMRKVRQSLTVGGPYWRIQSDPGRGFNLPKWSFRR